MFFILITVVPEPADEDEESGGDDEDQESGGDDEDEEQDDSEQDDSVQESKGGDDEEEEIIIEEDDESKGEQDEVPPKTTPVLKCFTNLIKSFLSNSKETATEPTTPESDDHRIEAINTLSILRAQVQKEVQAEVLKHSYKELRSKCSQMKLGGSGTAAALQNRLQKFRIEERFRLQLMEFEKQIKTHKPDADPEEDYFDLNQTIADFKSTFVDI
jgi:cobalamin biosynthesis protein CobT